MELSQEKKFVQRRQRKEKSCTRKNPQPTIIFLMACAQLHTTLLRSVLLLQVETLHVHTANCKTAEKHPSITQLFVLLVLVVYMYNFFDHQTE